MSDRKTISEALAALDPNDDASWTSAGLPSMAVLRARLGDEVTRAQVEAVSPGFTRDIARAAPGSPASAEDVSGPGDEEYEPDTQPGKTHRPPPALPDEPDSPWSEPDGDAEKRARLEQAKEKAVAELHARIRDVEAAVAARGKAEQVIDGIDSELTKLRSGSNAQRDMQLYLRRAQEIRERRAEDRRAGLAGLPRKSKIDQVMAENGRGFGRRRPSYPTQGAPSK